MTLFCCGLVCLDTMSVRWRGVASRRTSMLSDANYAHSTIAEEAIKDELENGNHFGIPTVSFLVLSCSNVTFFGFPGI